MLIGTTVIESPVWFKSLGDKGEMNSGSCYEMMTSCDTLDTFLLVRLQELQYYSWHDLRYILASFLVLDEKQT